MNLTYSVQYIYSDEARKIFKGLELNYKILNLNNCVIKYYYK